MKLFLVFNLLILSIAVVHADQADLPPSVTQKISSFGACVADGYVYVYGGHTGKAHAHSRENLSSDFLRYPLNKANATWEKLPEDKAVQGTALVAWNGLVIRVAGMDATNAPDEDENMFSSDAVRCYDPETKIWSDWPSLPGKVSSHDAVVANDVLYVIGGWELNGSDGTWHDNGWYLNLKKRDEGWQNLPAMPGVRRAGTLAAAGDEIWWVGGMADEGGPSDTAYAYHPENGSWREGPVVPTTSAIKAFGNSTFSSNGILFTSGMDGTVYSLNPAAGEWAVTSVNHQYGRIFHRSVPVGDGLFWTIAGASKKGHRDDIEVLPIPGQFPVNSSASTWPAFRGGANNGVPAQKMPRSWSDDSDIAWKVSLPGYGQSAPVFGNGGIYVTTAIEAESEKPEKKTAGVKATAKDTKPESPKAESSKSDSSKSKRGSSRDMASMIKAANGPMKTGVAVTRIDRESGKIAWTTTLPSSDPEPRNKYRSCAAPSPCIDDKAVYAWFETGDLVALNHEGEQQWHVNVGKKQGLPKGNHGLGGSLVQDRDSLYLLVDHDGPSYLLCLDKKNGETRWKMDREKRVAWSTPVVTGDAVIICSNGLVEEIDKTTGGQRWVAEGLEGNTVASPLVFADYVLAPSSEKGHTQLLRRGDTDERVVWKATGKNTASFASPVFAQGQIILVSKAGIASGLDWRTGEERWVLRLPDGCWATPVVLGNHVYFFSKSGATLVTSLTPSGLHELHQNDLTLESSLVYSVIPAGKQWIVRTGNTVTAIANKEKAETEQEKES